MINIVLCGGQGTRLWPISRNSQPKQYIPLVDGQSLFQKTVHYNQRSCDSFYFITNTDQYFLAKEQLSYLNVKNYKFLIEPVGRNTAPAITLACLDLNENDIVLVTPSDHLITQQQNYQAILEVAKKTAEENFLVTIGITPTSPETGYGYIECESIKNEVLDVIKFHEKPNAQTALQYISSGKFFWNAGIFCFKAGVFLKELRQYAPEILDACIKAYSNIDRDESGNENRVQLNDMQNIPGNSIDYAVLEHSKLIQMIPAQIGWTDLGCFDALDQILPKDEQGNTKEQKFIGLNSHNNMVLGYGRTIAAIDVDNCIIVDTPDALLVANKGSSQKVKQIISELEKNNQKLLLEHKTMYRPWGSYTILDDVEGYKIKRIEVKPGKRLSLQRHWHRSEHWIVVSGTATVTIGENTCFLRPNESTYIPMGDVHRLANEGKIPVVLIEAQVGEYTGEDDIERLDDDFKRN